LNPLFKRNSSVEVIDMVTWDQAKDLIEKRVKVGTDVNTARSSYRVVESRDDNGYRVRIGKNNVIQIPWSMLEDCFAALNSESGYTSRFFARNYPRKVDGHPCYVHTVGQILTRAGLAAQEGRSSYRAIL
jgi:hypothetical protein